MIDGLRASWELVGGAAFALGAGLFVRAASRQGRQLGLTRIAFVSPRVLPQLNGLRIAHLTDLHMRHLGERETTALRMVTSAADAAPHLVAVTGDIIERPTDLPACTELLRALTAPHGVFVVPGNNEARKRIAREAFAKAVAEAGARLLQNEHVVIEHSGARLTVAGIDDPEDRRDDLAAALRGAPEGLRLLLAHSPLIWKRAPVSPVDLILCGHTHGGQIRLPGIGAFWVNSRCGLRYAEGVFGATDVQNRPEGMTIIAGECAVMYVSRGIGTSLLPLRWLAPPEVTVITLAHLDAAH